MIKQLLKEKRIKSRGKTRKAYMLKLLEAADAAEAAWEMSLCRMQRAQKQELHQRL